MRYDATHAYILHTRPYRETSFIVDAFTKDHGRVHLIAKGAKRNARKALLQPFSLIEIAFQGRSDLMTLTQVEALKAVKQLRGGALICGLYMNELLTHLLHQHEPHADLFKDYAKTLTLFDDAENIEFALRHFEKSLLNHLGYGLDFSEINPNCAYVFTLDHGFTVAKHEEQGIPGPHLIEFGNMAFSDALSVRSAKRLMRGIFNDLLGQKKINSRELFV